MLACTHNQRTPRPRSAWSRRAALAMSLIALVLAGDRGSGQSTPTQLKYFKNFFVTGDFARASVDFGSQSHGGGFVTGEIHFNANSETVPADAEIVGAFLVLANSARFGDHSHVGAAVPR